MANYKLVHYIFWYNKKTYASGKGQAHNGREVLKQWCDRMNAKYPDLYHSVHCRRL